MIIVGDTESDALRLEFAAVGGGAGGSDDGLRGDVVGVQEVVEDFGA